MSSRGTNKPDPKYPTFFVVTRKAPESSVPVDTDDEAEAIRAEWSRIWNNNPPGPLFVLPPGADFDIAVGA